MKSLFFILLAGCAVRSSENNYYVIEMQDVPPMETTPKSYTKKPFTVYWNVPTIQCASKKIFFENLFEDFGIIQNDKDHFKGEKVTILYDPGLFPALFKNESGGKIRFRNGGVPQQGNLNKHLEEFEKELDHSIPDVKFSGVGIIDFESWRPQFRQNFGVLQPYKDVSFEIERKLHWWWKEAWIKEEAQRRFEEAARTYMESTLAVAKKLRPGARWGFYGFPYCFNMASNNLVERCADGVPKENDQIRWLWQDSTALYPSVYSSVQLSTSQLASLIRGRMREAARCAQSNKQLQILPYFWFRYRDAGFLTETDLSTALSMLYKSAANGMIIWGSSNDVNTVDKCTKLKNYVQNVLGPAIAKYTKSNMKDYDDNEENTTLSLVTDTEKPTSQLVLNADIALDPEFHWMPPDNYTQDLKDNVEEQINNRLGQNNTKDEKFSVLQNNSVLIDLILNAVLNNVDNETTTTDNPKNKYDKISQLQNEFVSTTDINIKSSTDTSQVISSIVTNNPLHNENDNASTESKTQIVSAVYTETVRLNETSTTEKFVSETDKTNFHLKTESISYVNDSTTTEETYTDDTDETTDIDYEEDDEFYNTDALNSFSNKIPMVPINDRSSSTDATNTDFTKDRKKIQTYTAEPLDTHLKTSTNNETERLTINDSDNGFNDLFIESESFFENNTSKEATNDNAYLTESKTDFDPINITKYIPIEETTQSSFITSSSDAANNVFMENENKVHSYTEEWFDTKQIETSTDTANVKLTTDESDDFDESLIEFIDVELSTEKYFSETKTDSESIGSTKYAFIGETTQSTTTPYSITTQNNEQNRSRQGDEHETNSSILTTTAINPKVTDVFHPPIETKYIEFEDELGASKTTEFKDIGETKTSEISETSKITETEDIEVSTSIVPSTEQVDVYY